MTIRILALLTVTLSGPADEQDGMPAHAFDLQAEPVMCNAEVLGDIGVTILGEPAVFEDGGVYTLWGGPPEGVPSLRPAVLRLPDGSFKLIVGKPDDGEYTVTLLAVQTLP